MKTRQPITGAIRVTMILAACCFCGAFLGVLVYAVTLIGYPSLNLEEGVGLSWMFGAIAGALVFLPVLPLLYRRDLTRSLWIIVTTTAVLTLSTGWIYPEPQVVISTCLITFLVAAVAAHLYLPRVRAVHQQPGLCHQCDYDLRGSLEIGRCPECGSAFNIEEVHGASAPRRSFVDPPQLVRLVLRHPLTLLLVLDLLLLVPTGVHAARCNMRLDRFEWVTKNAHQQNQPLTLTDATDFEWDDLVAIGPYPRHEEITNLGIDWPLHLGQSLPMREVDLFVFVGDDEVVEYFILSSWRSYLVGINYGRRISSDEAVFAPAMDDEGVALLRWTGWSTATKPADTAIDSADLN